MPINPATNRCHSQNRLTTSMAYRITNGKIDACPTCTELAWLLVAIDLDSQYGEELANAS